jgi:hypothetical protein
MTYTTEYPFLLLNGERVLLCDTMTDEELTALCSQYNADANKPKIDIDADAKARQVKQQAIADATAEIARLEATQARPLRELMLDPTNALAKNKVAEIEALIQVQREIIKANS